VPTYTQKKDCRYDYYVSKSESPVDTPDNHCGRIAVADIEAAVLKQVCGRLARSEYVSAVTAKLHGLGATIDQSVIHAAMQRLPTLWVQFLPVEQHRIIRLLIERIDLVHENNQQGFNIRYWPVEGRHDEGHDDEEHDGQTLSH
jgi:hypothetical protein